MGLEPEDQDTFKAIYSRLYTHQADGTLTTWMAPLAKLEGTGKVPGPSASSSKRRVNAFASHGQSANRGRGTARLRAAGPTRWQEWRRPGGRSARSRINSNTNGSEGGPLSVVWSYPSRWSWTCAGNVADLSSNRTLDQKNHELRIARENAVYQQQRARARLARNVFDQAESLWRTWPERGRNCSRTRTTLVCQSGISLGGTTNAFAIEYVS